MSTWALPIRVLVADDDAGVRAALVGLLAEEPDVEVVAQAADGIQAVAAARESAAGLVITDVRMPYGGPELVRRLVALPHRPVVVALSAQSDARTRQRMLAVGCAAYLVKGTAAGELTALIRRCVRGEIVAGGVDPASVARRRPSR